MKTIKAPTEKQIRDQIKNEIKRLNEIILDNNRSNYIRKRAHRLKLMFLALDAKTERENRIKLAQCFTLKKIQ